MAEEKKKTGFWDWFASDKAEPPPTPTPAPKKSQEEIELMNFMGNDPIYGNKKKK